MKRTAFNTSKPSLRLRTKAIFAVGAFLCAGIQSMTAAVKLGDPFGDHMVLPAGVPVAIWGTNAPGGDTVKVYIAGQTVVARSDWQGRWMVRLAPMKAGGPYQLLVEVGGFGRLVPSPAAIPNGGAELNDVLIGEVISATAHGPTHGSTAGAGATRPIVGEAGNAHPYASVRVWRARESMAPPYGSSEGSHWFYAAQDQVPYGATALFEIGRQRHEASGVPVGVIEGAAGSDCSTPAACRVTPSNARSVSPPH